MTIKVEANKKLSDNEHEFVIKDLQHKVKTMIGISSSVVVEAIGSLPRSEGKAKRVIDKR